MLEEIEVNCLIVFAKMVNKYEIEGLYQTAYDSLRICQKLENKMNNETMGIVNELADDLKQKNDKTSLDDLEGQSSFPPKSDGY